MSSLTPPTRDALLDDLEATHFDLVVIGGGITGAGVARDAAHRGLKVALVEADDFAVGTSSRSSKLIHGGLRYLAMGEVAMVRETALERKAVHQMAPHLAEPGWMVVAARNRASLMKFQAGIGTYEKLGAIDRADRHHTWGRDDILEREPALRTDAFPWACAYREYLTDDARLVLAVLRDAARHGATISSRTPVVGLTRTGERITGIEIECALSGRHITVRADAVVNAAGPWVEQLARLETPDARDRLHLSKGVHAVVSAERLPVRNFMIMSADDHRSIFALPRGKAVVIGTTDTSYRGSRLRWPEIDRADIQYLLDPVERYFDVEALDPSDVIAAWAGVRPLVAQRGKQPTEISRKDEVWIGTGGMVTVAGGKLTGFRAMAITIMSAVAKQLGRRLPPAPGPDPIPGGDIHTDLDAHASGIRDRTGVSQAVADRLVRLYGSETHAVLALGAAPIVEKSELVTGEIEWAVSREAALTLEDVIHRRTRAAWYNPSERDALLAPVAALMAELLGWDEARVETEIRSVTDRFTDELSFQGEPR